MIMEFLLVPNANTLAKTVVLQTPVLFVLIVIIEKLTAPAKMGIMTIILNVRNVTINVEPAQIVPQPVILALI